MKYALSALLVPLCLPAAGLAANLQWGLDNDVLFKSDGDYTNGMFLSYSSSITGLDTTHPVARLVPYRQTDDLRFNWFVQLGQKMWTPSDTKIRAPLPDERPYAGQLYVDTGFMVFDEHSTFRMSVMGGIVGPSAGAEFSQKWVHNLIGNSKPKGWDYQVKDQMVAELMMDYDRLFTRIPGERGDHEFSGYGSLAAGNLQPQVAAGLGWRWGKSLASNFNAAALRPFRQKPMVLDNLNNSWFLYGNLEARYRFDDITLNGDTPREVPDVTLEKGQGTAALGVVGFREKFGAGFSVVAYSKSFKEDKESTHYTSALTLYWLL
ncbi:MAG: lipid A deacylase LpxR family protein [Endozoicomonas sp.]